MSLFCCSCNCSAKRFSNSSNLAKSCLSAVSFFLRLTNISKSTANLSANSNPKSPLIASTTTAGGVSCSASSLTCSPSNKNKLEIPKGKIFSIYSSQILANDCGQVSSSPKIPNQSLPSLGFFSQVLTIRYLTGLSSSMCSKTNSIRVLLMGSA